MSTPEAFLLAFFMPSLILVGLVLTGRIVAHVREQRAQRRWLDRRAR